MLVACGGATALGATAAAAAPSAPSVNLLRPLLHVQSADRRAMSSADIPVSYGQNWTGYGALPARSGQTFTAIVGAYTVPRLNCAKTPNTFSYHWIGLDGWTSRTVEQDGIAADCNGTTPEYAAWAYNYPDPNFTFDFAVHPGDSINSAVHYLGKQRYELSLQDLTSGQKIEETKKCAVAHCMNSSAESITEAYYYNKRYSGTSDYGDERYGQVSVTDSSGYTGALSGPAWNTGEAIALGEYGDVTSTPGPLATAGGFGGSPASSAFSVLWERKN